LDADFRPYEDRFFALGELARQQRDRFDLCKESLPPGVEALPRILQWRPTGTLSFSVRWQLSPSTPRIGRLPFLSPPRRP
jgi:hypothetical protein